MNEVNKSLKMGVNRGCKFTLNFRTDVFRYLFNGKGISSSHGAGSLYSIEHFETVYFPGGWHRIFDKLGDGCKISFPLRMMSRVRWSQIHKGGDAGNHASVTSKYYDEVCTMWIV